MKRFMDVVVAFVVLIALIPVFLIVYIAVRMNLGEPVLFKQVRPGRFGKPFELVKFRTMLDARHPDGSVMSDEQRLNQFGRWLRSSSLDELPSLWNIIRGDMSLVGPRPLLSRYLELYTPEQSKRHDVRPGLTGWAQLNGRNAISWEDRFAYDIWYVENQSFWLDVKILVLTVGKVVRREGISAANEATMSEFKGSANR